MSLFVAKNLHTTNDVMNYIMNCDASEHPRIYEAIKEWSEQTTETRTFDEWKEALDGSKGVVVRRRINQDYYGEER